MKKRHLSTGASAGVSMAELLEETGGANRVVRTGFKPGERVQCMVLSIEEGYLTVDLGAKIAGFVNIVDLPEGLELPKVGDELELVFVEMKEGAARMTGRITAASGPVTNESLRMAFEARLPVEGTFDKEVKGGFEVTICGERAFCPFSQVDLFRDPNRDNAALIGSKTVFFVTEYDPEEHTLVVSRRAVLEKERQDRKDALRETLHEGELREGEVTRLMSFGAFVDLGGVEGLIPLRELSWDRDAKVEELLAPGQKVRVMVLAADWENEKFSLSLKAVEADPWDTFVSGLSQGQVLAGTVSKLMAFGAFVRLAVGVEGLLPIGRLGNGRRISHSREVLSEGQPLEVKVESIDQEAHRISLSLYDERVDALKPGELAIGLQVKGIVEGVRDFGVFVRLSEKQTGLLHVSECGLERGGDPVRKLEAKFAPGSDITVVVKSLDPGRVGLTLPANFDAAQEAAKADAEVQAFLKTNKGNASLGSLESLFDNLNL